MSTSNRRADFLRQDYQLTPIESLSEHPENPHIGDDDEVVASIKRNGFFGSIEVQRSTNYVLVGNTRYRALKKMGVKEVPVIFLDVDDDRARAIMLADNRVAQFGTFDDEKLSEALQKMAEVDDLVSTGYSDGYLTDLLAAMTGTSESYHGGNSEDTGGTTFDPSFEARQEKYQSSGVRSIILDYAIEEYQEMVERLAAARLRHGVESNAELIVALIAIDEEEAEAAAAKGA